MPIHDKARASLPNRNGPAKGRRKRPKRKGRSRSGHWHGVLRATVRADHEERGDAPVLDEDDVLAWADAYFERNGDWPNQDSGPIPEAPGETWLLVTAALGLGLRGFPPGGSIPRFLEQHRGRYNRSAQKFTREQVLVWADDWNARTGDWPTRDSGAIPGAGGVMWSTVDGSLRVGRGMMPGGSSLAQLLFDERGVDRKPPLSEEKILAWADSHHRRTGKWPGPHSGPISDAPDETWAKVNGAITAGLRGLPGGSSLIRLLIKRRGIRSKGYATRLTVQLILAWADAFHGRTGEWPDSYSGAIPESPGDTWKRVAKALLLGERGFTRGTSLSRLLIEERGIRSARHAPPLSIPQILAWADEFHGRTGRWPTYKSGPIAPAPGETWLAIDCALRQGFRGLAGGSSLARLLAQERGAWLGKDFRPFAVPEILEWADAYRARHGTWPNCGSGPVAEAPGETWFQVHRALREGERGLPGGSSLTLLLRDERGMRNQSDSTERQGFPAIRSRPKLTIPQVLAWADAYRERHGHWPTSASGPIAESLEDTWSAVHYSLRGGCRGLPRRGSLIALLAQERGAPTRANLPGLTIAEILRWADAHRDRHGSLPMVESGPIPEARRGESWRTVNDALSSGHRGLPSGSSLGRLLRDERGRAPLPSFVPFTVEGILAWADAHHARTGKWPTINSGEIAESPGDSWRKVHEALRLGSRGLPGGSSLAKLLAQHRGSRNALRPPDLTIPQILAWADAFHERNGRWPKSTDGAIPEAPGESWHSVRYALKRGKRGLRGESTITALLAQERGARDRIRPGDLAIPQVLAWADAFEARNGRLPDRESGSIPEAPGETWRIVESALRSGGRGLPGGLTLARFLKRERPEKPRKRPAKRLPRSFYLPGGRQRPDRLTST
jgi:hypothetical protein